VDFYSAWQVSRPQSAQTWITQFNLQTTPCHLLVFVRVHQMAPPRTVVTTSSCSLLLIYRPRKDERLSWPSVTCIAAAVAQLRVGCCPYLAIFVATRVLVFVLWNYIGKRIISSLTFERINSSNEDTNTARRPYDRIVYSVLVHVIVSGPVYGQHLQDC